MRDAKLSDAEWYIMQKFWEKGAMKTDELSLLVAEKKWKPTTLLTFLSRLAAKGMLQVEKQGKANTYTPCVSQSEYLNREGRYFLDDLYGGSARNFLAALVDGNGLSADELQDLKGWLATQEVQGDG